MKKKYVVLLLLVILLTASITIQLNKPVELISPLSNNIKLEENYVKDTITEQPNSVAEFQQTTHTGQASYYNREICTLHGTEYGVDCFTASGELFDDSLFTAACPRSLLGKEIKVTYKESSIVVKCNDTGSFSEKYGRALDLSEASFNKLAPLSKGIIPITYEEI